MQAETSPYASRDSYPPHPESRPTDVVQQGRYQVRFAANEAELEALLRLRYRIFNLELGEGLATSEATGKDEDCFDRTCHHLLVENRESASMVGTYRMQTSQMALSCEEGFYSAGEFDLSSLPRDVLGGAIEIGRACITKEHRNRQVLFLLWKGLARYLLANQKHLLFGCCSLNSQDPVEGLRVLRHLEARGFMHPDLHVPPQPGFECIEDREALEATVPSSETPVEIPPLFRTYLRYGAKVCGPPAIDREFKTIDFFVLFDVTRMDPKSYRIFFQ